MGRGGRSSGLVSSLSRAKSLSRDQRIGDNPERGVFLVGHEAKGGFGSGGANKKLSQPEAMLQGVLGWDWNKSKSSQAMEPGDTVFIRPNGTKDGKIAGYFTVGEKIVLNLPPLDELVPNLQGDIDLWDPVINPKTGERKTRGGEPLWEVNIARYEHRLRQDHPDVMGQIDSLADKVMESTDKDYYPRQRFIENILSDTFTSKNTFTFIKVDNPLELQDFKDTALLGGNKGLGMGTITLNGSDDPGSSSRVKRSTQLVADKERQIDKRKMVTDKDTSQKRQETDEEYEQRILEKIASAQRAADAAERLMLATEEADG